MALFITILSVLSLSCFGIENPSDLFCYSDLVKQETPPPNAESNAGIIQKLYRGSIFFGLGTLLTTLSEISRVSSSLCHLFPWTSSVANEFSLFGSLCETAARHLFIQLNDEWESKGESVPFSKMSWKINEQILSTVPASSIEEAKLLSFLQQHWLAKSAGVSSLAIDWVYPCFGIYPQVRLITNHCYTRLPSNGLSEAYKQGVELWKKSLPHPHNYPLILTRPFSLKEYFPSAFNYVEYKDLAHFVPDKHRPIVVDVTDAGKIVEDLKGVICIERLEEKEIGGIRILPLAGQSQELLEEDHKSLLEWISHFGLSANLIEVDRWCSERNLVKRNISEAVNDSSFLKEEFISTLSRLEEVWKKGALHKTVMLQGTVQVLKGLFENITTSKWSAMSPTQSIVAEHCIYKIKQQLEFLEKKDPPFLEMVSHLEQVHADFCSLLELFSPFQLDQFAPIYRDLLPIPPNLKPLTSCGIHSSAMTSLAGILKATRQGLGRAPRVLYGEHTYFECVKAVKKAAIAVSMAEASIEDLKQVDLLLAQFNPVLKMEAHSGYKVEDVAALVRQCLEAKQGASLTLALDCTIDFINSPRVAKLLTEFQEEIVAGALNIVGYRSGTKFDLFGMDNYCGAPFFMIHNQDLKWDVFNSLLTDSILQADLLSLNWFCLAYQHAPFQLELYRKQIFQNTRTLLNKIPSSLSAGPTYRVFSVDSEADAAFIDIKVSGFFHQKGAALVSGSFYMKAMEEKVPIFNRPSLGFYYPNFTFIFGEANCTLRLTLGPDPSQVELFSDCFELINGLNPSL